MKTETAQQNQQIDQKKPQSPVRVVRTLPAVRSAVRAGDLYMHNPGRS